MGLWERLDLSRRGNDDRGNEHPDDRSCDNPTRFNHLLLTGIAFGLQQHPGRASVSPQMHAVQRTTV